MADNVRIASDDVRGLLHLDDEGIEIAYFNEGCDWLTLLDEDIARSQEPRGLPASFINGVAVRISCDEATLAIE